MHVLRVRLLSRVTLMLYVCVLRSSSMLRATVTFHVYWVTWCFRVYVLRVTFTFPSRVTLYACVDVLGLRPRVRLRVRLEMHLLRCTCYIMRVTLSVPRVGVYVLVNVLRSAKFMCTCCV